MDNNLFGNAVHYEGIAPPFVLIGLLNRFDNRYQSAADAFFRELSWKQVYCLRAITLFHEAPTMQEIADLIGCSHQNIHRLCAKLLKDGYISSVKDAVDRRKQRLYLTEKAEAFMSRHQEDAISCVIDIFRGVSPEELETTIDVMSKLTKRLTERYD